MGCLPVASKKRGPSCIRGAAAPVYSIELKKFRKKFSCDISVQRALLAWRGRLLVEGFTHSCHKFDKIVIDYLLLRVRTVTVIDRPKHLPADERRAVTIEAVIELAAEQNPSDITTSAIAQRMGLTQGALFRHFPSKEAILQAVMMWVAERLLWRVDKAAQEASTPLAALEAIFMTHIDFVADHPGVPRMMFGELQRAGETAPKRMVQTLVLGYRERLQVLILQGKEQGELDAALDVEAAATLFVGTIQGLVMQSLMAGDVSSVRRNAPRVFAIYRRGIRSTQ